MAWYKQPIQPIDPILKDPSAGTPEQTIRYYRDNFDGNGQDSNTEPPAQDPAQWQRLTNIQPITQACLSRRWGYSLFSQFPFNAGGTSFTMSAITVAGLQLVQVTNVTGMFVGQTATIDTGLNAETITILDIRTRNNSVFSIEANFTKTHANNTLITWSASSNPATRMYSLQNNITLTRQIVYCASTQVAAGNEGGSTPTIVTNTTSANPPRMVDSRNYAYFYTGAQPDLLKWDGLSSVTNWGIASPSLATIGTSTTPTGGSVDAQTGSGTTWTNQGNELGLGSTAAPATATNLAGGANTKTLKITGFGFALPANAIVTGITAVLTAGSSVSGNRTTDPTWHVQLLKAGTAYGNPDSQIAFAGGPSGSTASYNLQTFADGLWGGTWQYSDINNANFGINVYGLAGNQIATFFLARVTLQIFYTTTTNAINVATGGAGNVTLTVGRTYYMVFQNSSSGHLSDLNAASASTGPVTNATINLSSIPVSPDAQVDSKVILATADGGDPSILYFVATIPNATTTYTDVAPETTLLLNQQYLFTDPFGNEFGVTFNDPPPNGTVCIKHKGRLWMAQLQNLFFSKAVAELTLPNGFIAGKYEESWPPQNYFDISAGAETISGLFSDGNVIYIGTQSHIRRIFGDSPTNFQQPEICHQDVGVLNQETWQNVFLEGTPTGFAWLTPDFKVMGSDGNTYLDIGHPIQDVLNTINPGSAKNSHAMFVQQGPYDLYMLAIPTGTNLFCDTVCVYNMRSHQWCVWTPADQSTAMLFNVDANGNPMWLFATAVAAGVNTYQYQSTATQDRVNNVPVDFTANALTSWLHLGSPSSTKLLSEIDIVGDSAMLISIFGASVQSDFQSPNNIVVGAPLVLSPFKTLKVYLAGKTTRYRYYQLQFQSTSNTDSQLLNAYSLRVNPFNTL